MAGTEDVNLENGREDVEAVFFEGAVQLSQEGDFVVLDRDQWVPLLYWLSDLYVETGGGHGSVPG